MKTDPMVHLVKFIEDNEDWRIKLTNGPNNIKINPHPVWPDTYVFSYNMIETKWSVDRPYLLACRGSMIEVDPNTRACKVVAYGFSKFFNLHEGHAAQVDWSSSHVYEKVDGSLVKAFTRGDGWEWMLNNAPTAEVGLVDTPINNGKFPTFKSLIDHAMKGHTLPPTDGWTLMFELTSPYNTVVLRYPEPELWLLGARSNEPPYEEVNPYDASMMFGIGFKIPAKYDMKTPDSVMERLVSDLNDGTHEGVVVCDSEFNRVKMKAESYLALHRLKDGDGQMGTRRLWQCINQHLIDDVVAQWPEFKEKSEEMISARLKGKKEMTSTLYYFLGLIEDLRREPLDVRGQRKKYALTVMESKYKIISTLCFALFNNPGMDIPSTVEDFIVSIDDYDEFSKLLKELKG